MLRKASGVREYGTKLYSACDCVREIVLYAGQRKGLPTGDAEWLLGLQYELIDPHQLFGIKANAGAARHVAVLAGEIALSGDVQKDAVYVIEGDHPSSSLTHGEAYDVRLTR